MQYLGDLHPTTCDLYLRVAEALCDAGDLEGSLVEYKSAITIYENMLGTFHVKMAHIYSKIAGVLMDKGEYETALSFYAKAYGIFDGTLGLHEDTKQALMNVKLAAEKNRAAKSSMAILVKAEEEFKKRHPSISCIATPTATEDANNNNGDNENDIANNEGDDGNDEANHEMNGSGKRKKKRKKKKRKDADAPGMNENEMPEQ